MMNGHPHGEQLSAYTDGMLNVGQMRAIVSHLAVCPQCRATQESLRRTKHLLGAMDAPSQPGPEFWSNAFRQMRVESVAKQRPEVSRGSWERMRAVLHDPQRRWSAGLAAAAVIVGAVVAPLVGSQGPAQHAPARPVAPVGAQLDSVDVSTLMQAHTESTAHEPMADVNRQDVIALDNSFAADETGSPTSDAFDAASDASP